MITKKEVRAIERATPEAQRLCYALKSQGVSAFIDFWDGHKHIDIAIPSAKINIEVDGLHHNAKPQQALADLKRTYYSFKKGYFTLRIPNSLIHSNLQECVNLILEMTKEEIKR